MGKYTFSLNQHKADFVELAGDTDHQTLAAWAIECAERIMPYFEAAHPQDRRPRHALDALQAWIATGQFNMAAIRKASLDAHAAAREVDEDNPARSAARAAGQAVAAAHVPAHAIGAALYALQAVHRATNASAVDAAVAREKDWQTRRLLTLAKKHSI